MHEAYVEHCRRSMHAAQIRYEASGCFSDAGEIDYYLLAIERAKEVHA